MQTIFLDLDFATAEKAEQHLWTTHTSLNTEYRRILGRLKSPANVVEKRKIEKFHHNFLRIAQKFYKGYVQRLSARYDIKELKRAAEGIGAEQMDAEDAITPNDGTSTQVLKSCHLTLIHLGDLARYRAQARHKKPNYETALTNYSLAHDLLPSSGFAFHQIGIVHLEEGRHLDVVYDFYRAWAVEEPHPIAKQNLEIEFKSLQQPSSQNSRTAASPGPYDAFSTWFVKLHAFFYKGEIFPQHGELETEVMHRLHMASKSPGSGAVLFKMLLINVAAYDVACNKYRGKCGTRQILGSELTVKEIQSDSNSLFLQYVLRLNVRFVLTLSETFEFELKQVIDRQSVPGENNSLTSPAIENLLPSLRTYYMWFVAHRQDITGAAETFGPLVQSTIAALAKIATLLSSATFSPNLVECPYLLHEDLETQGFRPLREIQVPETCRIYADDNEKPKPRLQSHEQPLEPRQENLARMLDTLRCVYALAMDPLFPIMMHNGSDSLLFEYRKVEMIPEIVAVPPAALPVELPVANEQSHTPTEPILAEQVADRPSSMYDMPTTRGPFIPDGYDTANETDNDLGEAEDTILSILAPFLKPPTPEPQTYLRSTDETSYGMHTATANEVFGQLPAAEPSPTGSVQSPKLKPLPWNWVYTPTPHKPQDVTINATRGAFAAQNSPGYSPREQTFGTNGLDDPFATPGRRPSARYTPRSANNAIASPPVVSAADEAHRNHLLQSFASPGQQRTSPFSGWAQNSNRQPKETVSPYTYRPVVEHQLPSSGTTGFSHPSSLYQGTPSNGLNYGMPAPGQFNRHRIDQTQQSQENGNSSNMRFQMDDTTSSYDAAILNSAFYNR